MRAILLLLLLSLSSALPAAGGRVLLRDCRDCAPMVLLPGGDFVLGSPESEVGRYPNEGPQQKVHLAAFAIGETEVTRGQFAKFVQATHRPMDGCYTPGDLKDLLSDYDAKASWLAPGFDQTDDHPVVCVSWNDAKAYAEWLSARTGQHYRLPTEAEWEYAARGGTTSAYFWGTDIVKGCAYMNGGDLTLGRKLPLWTQRTREEFEHGDQNSVLIQCNDGHAFTAPAKSYRPNPFGLYDITGNVWEWVEDCADLQSYTVPPGSASDQCRLRRTRGGSWDDWPVDLRSATRKRLYPNYRRDDTGFRLVREVTPQRH